MKQITCLIMSSILGLSLLLTACVTEPLLPAGNLTSDPGLETPCPDGIISFKYEILPLIVSNCASEGCHDAVSREEGVVLDSYTNIMKEVKPGKPSGSKLYKYLLKGDDDVMPPPPLPPLSAEQIELVKNWILQGAQQTTCGDACTPEAASFAANVYPTLQQFCIGCHNDNNLQGNVNLKDYSHIKQYVDNGKLLGSITHQAGFSPMPPAGNKLSDCRIAQITNWINAGAQND